MHGRNREASAAVLLHYYKRQRVIRLACPFQTSVFVPARLPNRRDVPLSYELLRGSAEQYGAATCRRVMGADYSAGVIAYNWSVDRRVDQLLHHNVFLSGGCSVGSCRNLAGRGRWKRGDSVGAAVPQLVLVGWVEKPRRAADRETAIVRPRLFPPYKNTSPSRPCPLPPGDFEGSWLRATSADSLSRSPNFYVHCPARTDPTAAPPGADSVMVLLPVANIQQVGACGLRDVCLKGRSCLEQQVDNVMVLLPTAGVRQAGVHVGQGSAVYAVREAGVTA